MKGTNHGEPYNRCNLCGADVQDGESYCANHERDCLDDCSKALDAIVIDWDTELVYRCMTKVLEGRT